MNILPILLSAFALQMINGKNKKPSGKAEGGNDDGLGVLKNGLLNDLLGNPDALSSLSHVIKLFDKSATQEEKSTAVFSLLSNPVVFEIAKHFFTSQVFNGASEHKDKEESFSSYSSTEEAREAFRPVAPIAGVEITGKLCHLYDNWYIKR